MKKSVCLDLTIIIISILFPICCQKNINTKELNDYQIIYFQWHKTLESELNEGKNWVYGDTNLLDNLSRLAPNHLEFLLERLENNDMWAVLILDANNNLQNQFGVEKVDTIIVQDRAELWRNKLRILVK